MVGAFGFVELDSNKTAFLDFGVGSEIDEAVCDLVLSGVYKGVSDLF